MSSALRVVIPLVLMRGNTLTAALPFLDFACVLKVSRVCIAALQHARAL